MPEAKGSDIQPSSLQRRRKNKHVRAARSLSVSGMSAIGDFDDDDNGGGGGGGGMMGLGYLGRFHGRSSDDLSKSKAELLAELRRERIEKNECRMRFYAEHAVVQEFEQYLQRTLPASQALRVIAEVEKKRHAAHHEAATLHMATGVADRMVERLKRMRRDAQVVGRCRAGMRRRVHAATKLQARLRGYLARRVDVESDSGRGRTARKRRGRRGSTAGSRSGRRRSRRRSKSKAQARATARPRSPGHAKASDGWSARHVQLGVEVASSGTAENGNNEQTADAAGGAASTADAAGISTKRKKRGHRRRRKPEVASCPFPFGGTHNCAPTQPHARDCWRPVGTGPSTRSLMVGFCAHSTLTGSCRQQAKGKSK